MVDSFFYLQSYFRNLPICKILNRGEHTPVDFAEPMKKSCEIAPHCLYYGRLADLPPDCWAMTAALIGDGPLPADGRLPRRCVIFEPSVTMDELSGAIHSFLRDAAMYFRISSSIASLFFQKISMQELLVNAGQEMGLEFILGDGPLQPIADSLGSEGPRFLHWEDYIQHGYAPELAWMNSVSERQPAFSRRSIKGYNWTGPGGGGKRLCVILSDGVNIVGVLVVLKPDGLLSTWGMELIMTLSEAVLQKLLSETALAERHVRHMTFEHVFAPILEREMVDWKKFNINAKHIGFPTTGCFLLVVVDLVRHTTANLGNHTLRTMLEESINAKYSMIVQDNLLMMFPFPNEGSYKNWSWTPLEKALQKHGLYAAVSRPFTDLADARRHYNNTLKELALSFYAEGTHLLSAEKTGLLFAVQAILQTESSTDIIDPKVMRLVELDRQNRTAYVETLRVYLQYSRKPLLACNALHIHRNTLDNRIQKIEELIGVDWNNGDEVFCLQLSVNILRYKEKQEQSRPLSERGPH